MSRDARLVLRPAALAHNARVARAHAPQASLFAMVKADAYGHGLQVAARALAPAVDGFGVAHLDEALALEAAGVQQPVMLLEGAFDAAELRESLAFGFQLAVHTEWQVRLLEESRASAPVPVWLKVDTGMHRLGLSPATVPSILERLSALPHVALRGLMTHFSCADQTDDPSTRQQLGALQALSKQLHLPFSAANSAALLRYPEAHGALVRPGIMLYGSSPLEGETARELGLAVTQRFTARLLTINTVAAGEPVGYGAIWRTPKQTRIGVVAVGYGDGYPRHTHSGTPVAIRGKRVPLVGRVSMDMLTVDLTDLPDAQPGDEVELWGDTVSVDEVAHGAGTISYELFCQITGRVHREVDESSISGVSDGQA